MKVEPKPRTGGPRRPAPAEPQRAEPQPSPRPATSAGRRSRRFDLNRLRPSEITKGAPLYPLLVLFALNGLDELDREAFNVLLPDIREHFDLSMASMLSLVSLAGVAIILIEFPIAHLADRVRRTRLTAAGTGVFGFFSLLTGLAVNVFPMMAISRVGTGLGRSTERPLHRSLLADYYDVDIRPGVYGFHAAANTIGQFVGPLSAGLIAHFLGWRWPFVIFAVLTAFVVVLCLRMRDPIRGAQERRIVGASEEVVATEEAPASMAEAWRILWQIRSLRRIWIALPFVTIPLVAMRPLLQLFQQQELGLNSAQRGLIAAINEPFQLVGLFVGIPIATRLLRRDPRLVTRFIVVTWSAYIVLTMLMVLLKSTPVYIVNSIVVGAAFACLTPTITTLFSLVLPPRVRSFGFTAGALFSLPAYAFAPILGAYGDAVGLTQALLVFIPIQFIGAAVIATSGRFMSSDIQRTRTSTRAMSEVRAARDRGEVKLLLVKDLDVAYDDVQVLFGVNFEVDEGEIVALLGTNGAGKSTLLRTISGLVDARAGAIIFDGVDSTYTPPNEVANRSVIQLPGGRGVFPSLSVAENLRIAGWMYRRDTAHVADATEKVLEYFPVLRDRWEQPAGNLSGGEQQMLSLGMVFVAKPRLLMIDELSLGLAPVIVERLLGIVRAIREQGTTIILVEQSVNLALTLAETAYFMEKGEIRFHGRTRDLLKRPDILRSVFLEGAASVQNGHKRATARTKNGSRQVSKDVVLGVDGLTKSFGGLTAVDGVSLELHRGEILGVIGPNGAGKTTLFDLISGFLQPDTGAISLDGKDVTLMPADLRAHLGLGRSFQDARLFPALTVWETIALALTRRIKVKDPVAAALALPSVVDSEKAVTARVDELIELMGLEAFRDKFVNELSTGSRRIVDLACVLAHEPSVLLFDEPSSGIAQRETEALGPLLMRIRATTGASLLVIEHDMPLVSGICDEMIALDVGKVVVRGRASEVVKHPHVVASYLGTSEDAISRSGSRSKRKPAKKNIKSNSKSNGKTSGRRR